MAPLIDKVVLLADGPGAIGLAAGQPFVSEGATVVLVAYRPVPPALSLSSAGNLVCIPRRSLQRKLTRSERRCRRLIQPVVNPPTCNLHD